jgi:excisionase family DNA binding protein
MVAVEKEFLNIEEVSDYLGIKKSSLYSRVEKKEIPHYRVGRLVRFKKSEPLDPRPKARRILKDVRKNSIDIQPWSIKLLRRQRV